MATTLDGDEEDIWHCYNQRSTSEISIRTLKEDWSFDEFSKDGFGANATDLFFKGMAYNLPLAAYLGRCALAFGRSWAVRLPEVHTNCIRNAGAPAVLFGGGSVHALYLLGFRLRAREDSNLRPAD